MLLNRGIDVLSVLGVIKSLRTIGKEWHEKTPYQKYCYMYSIGRAAFKLLALPLFEIDQKLNLYSYFPCFYITLYTLLVINTVIFHIGNGEFVKCLPCTCFLPLLLAVSVLLSYF